MRISIDKAGQERIGVYFTSLESPQLYAPCFDVYKNPSLAELRDKLGLGQRREVRALIVGDDLYAWPALDAVHAFVAYSLDLDIADLIRVEFFHRLNNDILVEMKAIGFHVPVRWRTHPYFESMPRFFKTWNVTFLEEYSRSALDISPQEWRHAKNIFTVLIDNIIAKDYIPEDIEDWLAVAMRGFSLSQQHLFAADCAERVLSYFERLYPENTNPREAIYVRRLYARGEASEAGWNKKEDDIEDLCETLSGYLYSLRLFSEDRLAIESAKRAARATIDSVYDAARDAANVKADMGEKEGGRRDAIFASEREWQFRQAAKYLKSRA